MSRLNEEVERMLKDADFQTRISGLKIADEVVIKVLQEAGDSDVLSTAVLATKLLARCAQSAVSSEAIVNAAFLIATGWQFDEKHKPQMRVLWCESCNRHWQIFPDAIDGEDEQIEPPAKRAKVESPKAVDLLSQHRHFCPWVAGRKSTGVDNYGEIDQKLWEFVKLPGWRQYAQALIFLGDPAETAIISLDSGDLTPTRAHDPVQALESVRAVLEL
ncbi:unnamed protein product [Phytophthora lilii]|uniref:Unnamed protein product n=1 Tax=Phytophthora lilii TaxID=2077276 RepID=A0A9W6WVS1_9STRA|nr:unnamed protein product [Phytophthora lilii]